MSVVVPGEDLVRSQVFGHLCPSPVYDTLAAPRDRLHYIGAVEQEIAPATSPISTDHKKS